MGAWGAGNFDNDTVSDWLADVHDWSALEGALRAVLALPAGCQASADVCSVALGAAEIVAACVGRPGPLPEMALARAAAFRERCDETVRSTAERCARRIEADSELQQLWDEGGRDEEWHGHVQDLIRRLEGS